jgi:hypothetical protein
MSGGIVVQQEELPVVVVLQREVQEEVGAFLEGA